MVGEMLSRFVPRVRACMRVTIYTQTCFHVYNCVQSLVTRGVTGTALLQSQLSAAWTALANTPINHCTRYSSSAFFKSNVSSVCIHQAIALFLTSLAVAQTVHGEGAAVEVCSRNSD